MSGKYGKNTKHSQGSLVNIPMTYETVTDTGTQIGQASNDATTKLQGQGVGPPENDPVTTVLFVGGVGNHTATRSWSPVATGPAEGNTIHSTDALPLAPLVDDGPGAKVAASAFTPVRPMVHWVWKYLLSVMMLMFVFPTKLGSADGVPPVEYSGEDKQGSSARPAALITPLPDERMTLRDAAEHIEARAFILIAGLAAYLLAIVILLRILGQQHISLSFGIALSGVGGAVLLVGRFAGWESVQAIGLILFIFGHMSHFGGGITRVADRHPG